MTFEEFKKSKDAEWWPDKEISEIMETTWDAATQAAEERMREKCAKAVCGLCRNGVGYRSDMPEPVHIGHQATCRAVAIRAIEVGEK